MFLGFAGVEGIGEEMVFRALGWCGRKSGYA